MDTRLEIIHETLYQYTKPTRFGQHRLVLRPRESHDLQVESMTLAISPAFEIEWSRDVFKKRSPCNPGPNEWPTGSRRTMR